MDSLNLNTQLPPRKRLLAGLKQESSDCELSLPSSDIFTHLRDLINSRTSSPDEIIEASKCAALAASQGAAAARATAMEKAAAAAKAKAAAKDALELLASISSNKDWDEGLTVRPKSRKKHVPVKLLYKGNRLAGRRETDEELARRLHRSMNSSPRILGNTRKKHGNAESSLVFCDKSAWLSRRFVDKLERKVAVNSKACFLDREGESSYSQEKHQGYKSRGMSSGKKVKIKQKKFLLSQCSMKDSGGVPRELPAPVIHSLNGEQKLDSPASNIHVADAKSSSENEASMKMTSMLKCKKIKISPCSSDSKILHALCSNSAATKTSSMVKVDQ